jgi:hypothetical protein
VQKAEKGFKPFYNQHLALCAKSPLKQYGISYKTALADEDFVLGRF